MTTLLVRRIAAPPARVYRALLDPLEVQQWMVPEGMTSTVHRFEAREGGAFRISLTYDTDAGVGKTTSATDTFSGRFARLVQDREVVQVVEFESDDPQMRGEMTITYLLEEQDGTTTLTARHDGLPAGVSAADNETGWGMSLDKLSRLTAGSASASG